MLELRFGLLLADEDFFTLRDLETAGEEDLGLGGADCLGLDRWVCCCGLGLGAVCLEGDRLCCEYDREGLDGVVFTTLALELLDTGLLTWGLAGCVLIGLDLLCPADRTLELLRWVDTTRELLCEPGLCEPGLCDPAWVTRLLTCELTGDVRVLPCFESDRFRTWLVALFDET